MISSLRKLGVSGVNVVLFYHTSTCIIFVKKKKLFYSFSLVINELKKQTAEDTILDSTYVLVRLKFVSDLRQVDGFPWVL